MWPIRWLLDTNAYIALLKGNAEDLRLRLLARPVDTIATSAVVRGELLFGAAKSQDPDKARQKIEALLLPLACLPFDVSAADAYGEIRATLERAGTPIGPNDLLIAATALTHHAVVVTRNTREFQRVRGLVVESW